MLARPARHQHHRTHLLLGLAPETQTGGPLLVAIPVVRPGLVGLELHHFGGEKKKLKSTAKFNTYKDDDDRRKVLLWGTSALYLIEISSSSLHFHRPRHIHGTVAITRSRYAHDVI